MATQWKSIFRKIYFNLCILSANLLYFVAGISITWHLACNSDEYTQSTKTWIYTILPLTATPMPLLFTYISKKLGRKLSLFLLTLMLLASDLIMGFSTCQKPPKTFLLARALSGFALGSSMTILNIYIHEICTSADKLQFFHSHRVFVSFGMFINHTMSTSISESETLSASGAPIVNLLSILIVTCFLVFLICFMPETPQYLIANKQEMQAKDVLIKLKNSTMIDGDFRMLCETIENTVNTSNNQRTIWQDKNWRKLLFIGMTMATFSEFSMAHIIHFYARDIFLYLHQINKNGTSWEPVSVTVQLVFLGVTQFVSAVIVIYFVGKFNRKTLVITCLIILSMVGLFPLACYFNVINKDAQLISNNKNVALVLEIYANVANKQNNQRKLKSFSWLTRNAKWTSWMPVLCFSIILALHNALGASMDVVLLDNYAISHGFRQWAIAICTSWMWFLWSVSSFIFGYIQNFNNNDEGQNGLWISYTFSCFVCLFGVVIIIAYLPLNKNQVN